MRLELTVLVLAAIAVASPAASQEQPATAPDEIEEILEGSGLVEALDSIAAEARPQISEAVGELVVAVADLSERVANDPELRRSALSAAEGMVSLTRRVLEENADLLERLLEQAADELDKLSEDLAEPAR